MDASRQDIVKQRLTLIIGATGYIGGRLLPLLESRGEKVRCMARRPEHLAHRVGPATEVVAGDLADPASIDAALAGVDTVYFLAHAMGTTGTFEQEEQSGAEAFAAAARKAGVGRIVYLGGLGEGDGLSAHLRSRQAVGKILRTSGIRTIEFRASIILGSGSLSYEMVRSLVERLPVMITPRWVRTLAQPIGIEDVLAYLVAALDIPLDQSEVIEIGGPDQVSYGDLMRQYAELRGLRRLMIPVPILTPRLSSLWLRLVTPLYARVGRKLIDGLRNATVVRDPSALARFALRPMGVRAALARALSNEDREFAATRWSDTMSASAGRRSAGPERFGTRLVDSRAIRVAAGPEQAFRPIARIGGESGWYYGNGWWRLRGVIDLLFGGPGLRRGRRDPVGLAVGATIDCWRVESVEPNRLLRLAAEMRLPGRAWLQFEITGTDESSEIRQTAIFDPRGLAGLLYWYALYPLHLLIFGGMLRGIAAAAARR